MLIPTGATQRPPVTLVHPPVGQGGTRAQTTPTVAVAGAIVSKGPVGHCVVPGGAWQPPKLPLDLVSMGHDGGHIVASMAPFSRATGALVRAGDGAAAGGARHDTVWAVELVSIHPVGQAVIPVGDLQGPPNMRVQATVGHGGRAEQMTPAVAVAGSSKTQLLFGQADTDGGASQLELSSWVHSEGHTNTDDWAVLLVVVGAATRVGHAVIRVLLVACCVARGDGRDDGDRVGRAVGRRVGAKEEPAMQAHVTPRVVLPARVSTMGFLNASRGQRILLFF